jgi:ubiquinone/menaquinone biosynthesis C-methylase UbiE
MILEPKKIIPLLGIQHGMTVLDVGSGVGFWTKQIAPLVGASGKVYAVDYHPDIIKRLYSDIEDIGVRNIYPVTADITERANIPLVDESCDKILVIRMIQDLDEQVFETIKNLTRLLREKGEIIIIDSAEILSTIKKTLQKEYSLSEITLVEEKTSGYYRGIKITVSI